MTSTQHNNKRIAKNTLALYARMLLIMLIALYTSRILLNSLGIEDFGIYNVVGGLVAMFGFLNGAMSIGTQRFLNIELGKKDFIQLKKTFSMTLNIHIIIAAIILIFAETIGLWFLNFRMVIPQDRIIAANWVFQFSILSAIIGILQVPYNAMIIAQERMNVYAYISVIEVTFRLIIVFLILQTEYDKLIVYGALTFIVSIIIQFCYYLYCIFHFNESKYHWDADIPLFKSLINFSGWNLLGSISSVLSNHGSNILLNIFFGPLVNAARAVAVSVDNALSSFSTNFLTAVAPQITKRYAAEEHESFINLIVQSTKFSYYLKIIIIIPIVVELEQILKLWLKSPPEYSYIFTLLIIIDSLVKTFSSPLIYAAYATGKIKIFQSIISGLMILKLPLAYIILKYLPFPEVVFIVAIFIDIVTTFVRLKLLHKMISLDLSFFLKNVILNCFSVTIAIIILMYGFIYYFEANLTRLFLSTALSFIISLLIIYFIGLNKSEKEFIKQHMLKYKNVITKSY